jgi:hypothetical protein
MIGKPSPLNLGCGVTAHNPEDAVEILRTQIFALYGEREIEEIVEDVALGSLDADHILPNIGNPAAMGA